QGDGLGALAGVLVDGGLGVEQVGAEGAAIHEQLDDAAGARSVVWLLGLGLAEQRGEGDAAEAAPQRADHLAPPEGRVAAGGGVVEGRHGGCILRVGGYDRFYRPAGGTESKSGFQGRPLRHTRRRSCYFFFLGSSSGLTYSSSQGPSPWNCTTVSPSTQTKCFI